MLTETSSFTQNFFEKKLELNSQNIPKHVGIVMDGNRRWAEKYDLAQYLGHWAGAQTLETITRAASIIGVQTLTAYSFSTENWNRTDQEKLALFEIFERFLIEQKPFMLEEGITLKTIGDLTPFPQSLKDLLDKTKLETKDGKFSLVLALNYGSRDEMRRAIAKMCQKTLEGKLEPNKITEQTISSYLDTCELDDVDLLIRTSGEMRLSNFLLWQQHYAELFFTETLWPDFTPDEFVDILLNFQKRQRRRGK